MELEEAIKAVEKDDEVRQHTASGFYLSSAMAIPETLSEIMQWTLVYFNPRTQKVFSVEVSPGTVKKGKESTPLVEGHYEKLGPAGALGSRELLSKLTDIIAAQKELPVRVIITLRDGEWKVAVVTKSLKMLRVDLGMATGELKHIDKSPLVKTA